jgi:protein TonB
VKIVKQDDRGDPNGIEGGEEGGVEGGVIGGVVGGPPPPPPPPPPPRNIPPTLLDRNRIAGDKYISPDAATVATIIADKRDTVVASLKLCVGADGDVTQVVLLKSSRYPDYDQKLATEMRAWKYRPYIVNGNAVPVCTAVTFIWSNKP